MQPYATLYKIGELDYYSLFLLTDSVVDNENTHISYKINILLMQKNLSQMSTIIKAIKFFIAIWKVMF